MAKEPDDLVVRILREIQTTLAEHSRMHEEHRQAFARIEKQQAETRESMVTALGLAAHANVRHETVEHRLDEIIARLERLEAERQ